MLIGLILIATVGVVGVLYVTRPRTTYTFSKSITRNTGTTEEQHALSVSESVNYTSTFNVRRLAGFGCEVNTSDYSEYEYVWAGIIDSEVVNYYDACSDSLKGNASIRYNYAATVHSWGQINVTLKYEERSHGGMSSLFISSPNGTILFQNKAWESGYLDAHYAYYDGSWRTADADRINFNLSESYFVEMYLDYKEFYSGLAAFWSWVVQTVIMDGNYQPRLISLFSTGTMS